MWDIPCTRVQWFSEAAVQRGFSSYVFVRLAISFASWAPRLPLNIFSASCRSYDDITQISEKPHQWKTRFLSPVRDWKGAPSGEPLCQHGNGHWLQSFLVQMQFSTVLSFLLKAFNSSPISSDNVKRLSLLELTLSFTFWKSSTRTCGSLLMTYNL